MSSLVTVANRSLLHTAVRINIKKR